MKNKKQKNTDLDFLSEGATPFEEILLSFHKEEMIEFVNDNPDAMEEALELALTNKQPLSWRSAWLIWSCISYNNPFIVQNIDKIISYIPSARNNQKRELIKILLLVDLSPVQSSTMFDISSALWTDSSLDPSIRMNALKMLLKISNENDSLKNKIINITTDNLIKTLTGGAQKSVKKLLNSL